MGRELFHAFFRGVVIVLVVVLVWLAAGAYYRESFRDELKDIIEYRVRAECVRPAYVQNATDAKQYDLSVYEMDLVAQKMQLLNRRTDELVTNAEKLQALRIELVSARKDAGSPKSGVGGPFVGKNGDGGLNADDELEAGSRSAGHLRYEANRRSSSR